MSKTKQKVSFVALLSLWVFLGRALSAEDVLPGTAVMEMHGDISEQMHSGISKFLDREVEQTYFTKTQARISK